MENMRDSTAALKKARIKVVGFYEDLACGLRISRLCSRLTEKTLGDPGFTVRLYSFDLLKLSSLTQAVAREAAHADAVIVAAYGPNDVPRRLKSLLGKVLDDANPAIIELFEHELTEDSPAQLYLQNVAALAQLSSVASSSRIPAPDAEIYQDELVTNHADAADLFGRVHCAIND